MLADGQPDFHSVRIDIPEGLPSPGVLDFNAVGLDFLNEIVQAGTADAQFVGKGLRIAGRAGHHKGVKPRNQIDVFENLLHRLHFRLSFPETGIFSIHGNQLLMRTLLNESSFL